ncbi:hypothetical protein [Nakamurella lactea]|uniref:hypothetical protein n=1 Tax=Nakamurella lactea TaxID=459515 RepID=UPI00041A68D8|nr:hypothetical protein [Nakamurella lactea]
MNLPLRICLIAAAGIGALIGLSNAIARTAWMYEGGLLGLPDAPDIEPQTDWTDSSGYDATWAPTHLFGGSR